MRPIHLVAGIALLAGCSPEPARAPVPSPASAGTSAAAPRASSCPANDFETFLQRFAADRDVRLAHTAPTVRVRDWVDASVVDPVEETTLVPKEQYEGFTLRFLDGSYYHLDAYGKPYGDPVDLKVTPRGSDVDVRYVFGMSEGNSWTFTRERGCWTLTADPEPSWE